MSQPLIIGAVTIAAIDTVITDLQSNDNKGPQFRILIGGFVVMVTLLALSDANEQLADSLALIILLATLVGPKGGALSKTIIKLTGNAETRRIGEGVISGAQAGTAKQPTTYTQN